MAYVIDEKCDDALVIAVLCYIYIYENFVLHVISNVSKHLCSILCCTIENHLKMCKKVNTLKSSKTLIKYIFFSTFENVIFKRPFIIYFFFEMHFYLNFEIN